MGHNSVYRKCLLSRKCGDRQTETERQRQREERDRERETETEIKGSPSVGKVRYDSIQPRFLLCTNVGYQSINALCKAAIIHSASHTTRVQWVCSV